jgi:hypothetical protein
LIINENLEKIKSRYTLKDIKVLSKWVFLDQL